MSIKQTSEKWGITVRRIQVLCTEGRIPGATKIGLYWAIPVGNYNHRDASAKRRINNFINLPPENIASCYYHIGQTTIKSIFFISDVIPVIDKYIERGYINNYTASIHIVKNKTLISELENKLKRILAYENSNPNFFRQHITDVKNELLKELI